MSSAHTSSELPNPGEVPAGRFHIERSLGVAGMGGVFAA
jgi:hypothetical protein